MDTLPGCKRGSRAKLAKTAEADQHYFEAVALLRRFGGALSPDLALLDFSEFRISNGLRTKDLGALVMTWLKEGRYDAKTAQVAAKMVRVFCHEAPTLIDIADLRQRFEQAGGVTVPPRLK